MRLAGKGRRHALKEMAKASRHEMFAADIIELADTANALEAMLREAATFTDGELRQRIRDAIGGVE